jgi:hypothetical protein
MLGTLKRPDPPGIEPRPLHNTDGTLRAQCAQLLMDLDRSRIETPVQSALLEIILLRLREFLADTSTAAKLATSGAVTEAARNPNLAYWQAKAEEDADRPEPEVDP